MTTPHRTRSDPRPRPKKLLLRACLLFVIASRSTSHGFSMDRDRSDRFIQIRRLQNPFKTKQSHSLLSLRISARQQHHPSFHLRHYGQHHDSIRVYYETKAYIIRIRKRRNRNCYRAILSCLDVSGDSSSSTHSGSSSDDDSSAARDDSSAARQAIVIESLAAVGPDSPILLPLAINSSSSSSSSYLALPFHNSTTEHTHAPSLLESSLSFYASPSNATDKNTGGSAASAASASSSSFSSTTVVMKPQQPTKHHYQWTKHTLALALPALIGMLSDPVLSLVDTLYVGRVGSLELAALGACTSIFHVAFNAFRATTAATTTLVSTARLRSSSSRSTRSSTRSSSGSGSGSSMTTDEDDDNAAARQVAWLSLQLGFGMGMLVLVGLMGGGQAVLTGMGVPPHSVLYTPARDYLRARSWAAPAVLWIGVSEGIFRGYGNTVVPLLASLTAALMNLVLDPVLMFPPIHWGVTGAAAATALSQWGAAAVYGWVLVKRGMLPRFSSSSSSRVHRPSARQSQLENNRSVILRTILMANFSMLIKQGSLLLGWAFATARATRLGPHHVAAHQVALSVWLLFALILDGAAVSAQVLMSRAYHHDLDHQQKAQSLFRYMLKLALFQGGVSMLLLYGLDSFVPFVFTPDPIIQSLIHTVMPKLAAQQVLVSLTLVIESLAAGANQFGTLALGTTLSTLFAVQQIQRQSSVQGIWSRGITTLFAGRLVTACIACMSLLRGAPTNNTNKKHYGQYTRKPQPRFPRFNIKKTLLRIMSDE